MLRRTKQMKLLAALVLIGCLIISSVSTNNEQEVTISSISITRARILVRDIRNANKDLTDVQFAVLCLVPRTQRPLTIQNLGELHLCTPATRPNFKQNPWVHSETQVLGQWGNLLNAFMISDHNNLNYDMFLFTYYSPCNNCAKEIVTAVNTAKPFGYFYVTFWTPYRDTLDATRIIFQQHNVSPNRSHRITMYEQFGPRVQHQL